MSGDYIDVMKVGTGEEVDLHDAGRGVAGGVATLDSNGKIPGTQIPITTLLDIFYPVGSYLETSDSSYNPNVSLGGSWIKETEGMVHVSGGTNYSVSKANNSLGAGAKDGGNKDAIIPYHRHSVAAFTNASNGSCSIGTSGGHQHLGYNTNTGGTYGEGWNPAQEYVGNRSANIVLNPTNGAHTHTVPNHTHTISAHNTNYEGVSVTNANMQPYINVYRWHRTA